MNDKEIIVRDIKKTELIKELESLLYIGTNELIDIMDSKRLARDIVMLLEQRFKDIWK